MRKPGTIFLLAIFIGALSAALMFRYVRGLRAEVEEARRAASRDTVEIAVAKETISIGSRIESQHVKMVRWPVGMEPEGAMRDLGSVVGNIARTTIVESEPVLRSAVAGQGGGLLPSMIAEGMRAMSVKVDNVTGVSGFITPNSRVDVLVAGSAEGRGRTGERSKLVLQNVKVLATGTSIEQHDDKPVEVPTVTLMVTAEDAEKLTLAARHAPVRLALRNYRDEEVVHTRGVTAQQLFSGDGKAGKAKAPVRQWSRRPRYSVEFILGDKPTKQELY